MEKVNKHLTNLRQFKAKTNTYAKNHLVGLSISLAIMSVFGLSVAFFIGYYSDKAAPGTTIAGKNIGGQTRDQIIQTIDGLIQNFRLSINYNGKSATASHTDFGVKVDIDSIASRAVDTGKHNLFGSLVSPQNFGLDSKIDQDAVKAFVNKNFSELSTNPVDTTVKFNQKSGRYDMIPGGVGHSVQLKPLYTAILTLAEQPKIASYQLTLNHDKPQIIDSYVKPVVDKLNSLINNRLSVTNDGRVLRSSSPRDYSNWINLTPNKALHTYDINFDDKKIAGWVNDIVGRLPGRPINAKAITSESGEVYKIVSPGKRGQLPTNLDTVIHSVQAAAKGHIKDRNFDVVTQDSDFQTDGIVAPGGHWAEATMGDYTVRIYDGANVTWSTNSTSHGKPDSPTPTGIFHVTNKVRGPKCMPNPPSKDPLCNINYVTYFTNQGHAFHEAWWLHAGNTRARISHGCINMLKEEAHKVFDWLSVGSLVYIH